MPHVSGHSQHGGSWTSLFKPKSKPKPTTGTTVGPAGMGSPPPKPKPNPITGTTGGPAGMGSQPPKPKPEPKPEPKPKLKPEPEPKPKLKPIPNPKVPGLMVDNTTNLRNTIKTKRINAYGSQNFGRLNPNRHFAFNQEMSNAIREYAAARGVKNAWGDNKFIDKLYNFTGAAHSSSMYPGTQVPQSIYAAAYQGLDAVIETYQGKSKPMKALSDGVSDFFQNVKGIFSAPKSEDELLEEAFDKIDNYVAGGLN